MKVLWVTSKSLGGSGKYISVLSSALESRINQDLIYFPMGVAQDREIEKAFDEVFHYKSVPTMNPIRLISLIIQTRKLIRNNEYDIVHSHTSLGGLIGRIACIGFRCKSIQTLHAFGADEFTPYPQKAFYWLVEWFLDFFTDRYIAPSEHMKKYGSRLGLFNPTKVEVIYNALPLRQPEPKKVASDREKIRNCLKISDETVVFLFCGRLEPQKGVDVLISSLADARLADMDYVILICGEGQNEAEYKSLAESLNVSNRLVWLGWQVDVEPYYAACDVYIMPSRWESFGLVFLEAMNFSKPILATTTQAIPEVVKDQVCGLLSVTEKPSLLAHNIGRLIDDSKLRCKMGQAANDRLKNLFAFDTFVEKSYSVYRSFSDS